jgi:UDP-N-acetylmuramoylalanine--D-glutamate ligase
VRFSELEGARIGVWGAGREIASFASQVARRLPDARIELAAFDEPPAAEEQPLPAAPSARVVRAAEALDRLAACDVVVRSPGVSIHRRELAELRARVPVTTATSLWVAERGGRRVVAVTGTKGKSTTAALIHHLARAAGEDAELAGNIGRPALDLLDADPQALAVLELSSYQIADLAAGPEVAVLTSLYDEHADWHGSARAYREDKLRLFSLPQVRRAVLPAGIADRAHVAGAAERILFGEPAGWSLDGSGGIAFRGESRLAVSELPLPGPHNALNLCAALAALEAAGVALPPLPGALAGFAGLEHRLQTVLSDASGVSWIDDSISTTPESALAALASFPERAPVLIGGGQDRGQDYGALAAELARRNGALVAIGSTGPRLREAAIGAGLAPERALAAAGLEEAVAAARRLAAPGTVVLLSPAAPSYDGFRDFEQRGERFAALVRAGAGAA